MAKIIKDRMTATRDDGIVVFLIGMRVNSWWKIHRWLPVANAMPRMMKELLQNPESGLLGATFALTSQGPLMVQYWSSTDKLMGYASDRKAEHYPAFLPWCVGATFAGASAAHVDSDGGAAAFVGDGLAVVCAVGARRGSRDRDFAAGAGATPASADRGAQGDRATRRGALLFRDFPPAKRGRAYGGQSDCRGVSALQRVGAE